MTTYKQKIKRRQGVGSTAKRTGAVRGKPVPLNNDKLLDFYRIWNGRKKKLPEYTVIHALFEWQAEKAPAATAVECGRRKLRYGQLNKHANRLAHFLATAKQLAPEEVVGIMMRPSPESITAMLACLKAGGAFLVIDPDFPEERIRYMLAQNRVTIILADRENRHRAEKFRHGSGMEYDEIIEIVDLSRASVMGRQSGANPDIPVQPGRLAYIAYTSGSTGRPKGIAVEHGSAVNFITFFADRFRLNRTDRVLQLTRQIFDASYRDIFVTLISGGTLVLPDSKSAEDFSGISRTIAEKRISRLASITPTVAGELADHKPPNADWSMLKSVHLAGELLHLEVYARLRKVLPAKTRIYNHYGPTECTMVATYYETKPADLKPDSGFKSVPVGHPISNAQIFVLDNKKNLLPPGVPGEIYIAGIGLARGYIHDIAADPKSGPHSRSARRERAGSAFLPHPFRPGERIYKTGDLAKLHQSGELEIIGRADRQLKIRGIRVEPAEIEGALRGISDIREAAVVPTSDETAKNSLTVYYTSYSGRRINSPHVIRKMLGKTLPSFMIPSRFIFLENMPRTAGGKIDYRVLPETESGGRASVKFAAPVGPTEKRLSRIWQKVLGIEKISRFDNFFDIGGQSLMAIRLNALTIGSFGTELGIKNIFLHPVLSEMAECLKDRLIKSAKIRI